MKNVTLLFIGLFFSISVFAQSENQGLDRTGCIIKTYLAEKSMIDGKQAELKKTITDILVNEKERIAASLQFLDLVERESSIDGARTAARVSNDLTILNDALSSPCK